MLQISQYTESLLNLTSLALGIAVAVRAKGNRLQLIWGILVTTSSILMLEANLRILTIPPTYNFGVILRLDSTIKWFVMALLYSFIPLIALSCYRKVFYKIAIATIPLIFSIGLLCAVKWIGVSFTETYSWNDFFANITRSDLQIRLVVFLLSLAAPFSGFALSYIEMRKQQQRNPTNLIYYYTAFMLLAMGGYIAWTCYPAPGTSTLCVFGCSSLPIVFSYLFLISENPFSTPLYPFSDSFSNYDNVQDGRINLPDKRPFTPIGSKEDHLLFSKINRWMMSERPFCNPAFSGDYIYTSLNITQEQLTAAIRCAGFMNLREYISTLRVCYFKQLTKENPYRTITQMAEMSGFSSRITFYRNFEACESESPKLFLKRERERCR